uniref:L1 transposable element RRM domain-containing protein n=1 Tax=Latimeria chalumnae TaxID=7897 RepID=H3A8P9_LATCH
SMPKMASDNPTLEPATSAEISSLMTLMQGVAADVASIRTDVADIQGNLESLGQRVFIQSRKLEGVTDVHEARLNKVEEELVHQTRYAGELWDRVRGLENRSSRNNVRVLGIPEGVEGNGVSGPTLLLSILQDCLPLGAVDSTEVERAHRTLGPRPPPDQHPRPIIARLLRFQDRECILRLARETGELHWQGGKIMIFPDMSRELAAQRKLFTPARRRCMELGLCYALQYLAVLQVTVNGGQHKFEDREEAIRELNRILDQNCQEEGPQPQRKNRR